MPEGDKTVPLRFGVGGPVIGTATVHPDGTADLKVTNPETVALLFPVTPFSLSPDKE